MAAWAHAAPGGEIGGGRKPGHVGAGLGDDYVDREAIETRHRKQPRVDRPERRGASIDLFSQRSDRLVEEVDVSEDATAGHGVVGAEVAGQRFGQRRDLRSHLAFREPSEPSWILLAIGE